MTMVKIGIFKPLRRADESGPKDRPQKGPLFRIWGCLSSGVLVCRILPFILDTLQEHGDRLLSMDDTRHKTLDLVYSVVSEQRRSNTN
jgi:hypothetical protein